MSNDEWLDVIEASKIQATADELILQAELQGRLEMVLSALENHLWPKHGWDPGFASPKALPARPVSLRDLRPGDPCPRCKATLKALLANPYCPNDCDQPESNAVPTPVKPEKTEPWITIPTGGTVAFTLPAPPPKYNVKYKSVGYMCPVCAGATILTITSDPLITTWICGDAKGTMRQHSELP